MLSKVANLPLPEAYQPRNAGDLDGLDNWQLEEDAYNCTVAQYWAKAARYFEKAIAEDKADPFEDEDEAICAIADMAVEMGRKFHQNQLAEYGLGRF